LYTASILLQIKIESKVEMISAGNNLATTTAIAHQHGASASNNIVDLNLLSDEAWLHYGHREFQDYVTVSKKKASKSKSPESL